jgi:hypothetical protein
LHRQYWEKTQLQNGDRLEIVTIVGGGWFCWKSFNKGLKPLACMRFR